MQSLNTDIQSLGGNGGYGLGGGGSMDNPLLWLITLGFLGGKGGLLGGNDSGNASVTNTTGIAENSAKLDCLAQGHATLARELGSAQTQSGFDRLTTQINELAGIERDQNTLLSNVSRDINDTVFRESSATQRMLAECCCRLEKGQANIETAVALQTNTLTMNANSNTQKILDQLCNDRVNALEAQNNNLQRELGIAQTVKELSQVCGGRPGNSGAL